MHGSIEILLMKLAIVPAFVAFVTMAARRWGALTGGLMTGLPVVGGPTLCFYALEQGDAFAVSAARATMLGIVVIASFCVMYARAAKRMGWGWSVVAGWSISAGVAALLYQVGDLRGIGEVAIALAGLLIAVRLLPAVVDVPAASGGTHWDIPLRMAAATASVVLLTGVFTRFGPRISGIAIGFPVVTMVLGVFTHAQDGFDAVAVFFRGVLLGLHGFALFCLVFSSALAVFEWSLTAALSASLVAQLMAQTLMLRYAAPNEMTVPNRPCGAPR